MTHAFRTREQHAANRVDRIKAKYQDLVNAGLFENHDGRSFTNTQWSAIIHFPSKTVWVYTLPIVSTSPAAFIKSCECGGVHYKDLQPGHEEAPVDMEEVLKAIRLALDFDGDNEFITQLLPTRNPQLTRETV